MNRACFKFQEFQGLFVDMCDKREYIQCVCVCKPMSDGVLSGLCALVSVCVCFLHVMVMVQMFFFFSFSVCLDLLLFVCAFISIKAIASFLFSLHLFSLLNGCQNLPGDAGCNVTPD